jgi:hypothetical protein
LNVICAFEDLSESKPLLHAQPLQLLEPLQSAAKSELRTQIGN